MCLLTGFVLQRLLKPLIMQFVAGDTLAVGVLLSAPHEWLQKGTGNARGPSKSGWCINWDLEVGSLMLV